MQMNRKWLFVKNDGNADCFFKKLGMQDIADHCVRLMEDYRKEIGKREESDSR